MRALHPLAACLILVEAVVALCLVVLWTVVYVLNWEGTVGPGASNEYRSVWDAGILALWGGLLGAEVVWGAAFVALLRVRTNSRLLEPWWRYPVAIVFLANFAGVVGCVFSLALAPSVAAIAGILGTGVGFSLVAVSTAGVVIVGWPRGPTTVDEPEWCTTLPNPARERAADPWRTTPKN